MGQSEAADPTLAHEDPTKAWRDEEVAVIDKGISSADGFLIDRHHLVAMAANGPVYIGRLTASLSAQRSIHGDATAWRELEAGV